jgi:hypothetical protein
VLYDSVYGASHALSLAPENLVKPSLVVHSCSQLGMFAAFPCTPRQFKSLCLLLFLRVSLSVVPYITFTTWCMNTDCPARADDGGIPSLGTKFSIVDPSLVLWMYQHSPVCVREVSNRQNLSPLALERVQCTGSALVSVAAACCDNVSTRVHAS